MSKDDHEHVEVATRAQWRRWLSAHHATRAGARAVTFKKSSGRAGPSYDDLVEEALCYGWVDSTGGKVDAERTKLYFAPRKKGSGWAATNKGRVERLVAEGLMAPAGLAAVESARADGSWTLLDASEAAQMGDDLRAALARYACAGAARSGSRRPRASPRRTCARANGSRSRGEAPPGARRARRLRGRCGCLPCRRRGILAACPPAPLAPP